eukprot:2815631-Alexandrium_andersonii.AAC.1
MQKPRPLPSPFACYAELTLTAGGLSSRATAARCLLTPPALDVFVVPSSTSGLMVRLQMLPRTAGKSTG